MNLPKPNSDERTHQDEVSPEALHQSDDLGQAIRQALLDRVNQAEPTEVSWGELKAGLLNQGKLAQPQQAAAKKRLSLPLPQQMVQATLALVLFMVGSMYLKTPPMVEPMPQLIANIPVQPATEVFDEYMSISPELSLRQTLSDPPEVAIEAQAQTGLKVPLDLLPHPLSNQGRQLSTPHKQRYTSSSGPILAQFDANAW